MQGWFELDNAAKLFPAISTFKNSSVYRVSIVLNSEVNASALENAVKRIHTRFPMLFVQLRKGLFWHYLDQTTDNFVIEEEKTYPCSFISPKKNNGNMLRILHYKNRISIEIFHSITDGSGAIEFLKSLLYYYLIFDGKNVAHENKILLADSEIDEAEFEDSYSEFYNPNFKRLPREPKAYRISGTPFDTYGTNLLCGIISSNDIKTLAKQAGCSITVFTTAVLIQSIQKSANKQSNKPIAVIVPVNLKAFFPSKTFHNFVCTIKICVSRDIANDFTLLLKEVEKQLKEKTDIEYLTNMTSSNIRHEKGIFRKFAPLIVKNIFVSLGFWLKGENRKTITYSNLGNISLPSDMEEYISHIETVLYTTPKSHLNCSVCSSKGKTVFTFSRNIIETNVIRAFFNFFTEKGLDVTIYSNNWGVDEDEQM